MAALIMQKITNVRIYRICNILQYDVNLIEKKTEQQNKKKLLKVTDQN